MSRLCFETEIASFPIRLEQTGVDRFRVTYFKQVKPDLRYGAAAAELGACIMHALACEGRLDNQERGES